jgi:alpha-glucosidase
LRGGTHQASILRDDPAEPAAVKLENTTLKPAAPLTIELVAGGGFIARFEPTRP